MAGSLKLFLRYGSPEMSAMYVNLDKTGSQYLHPILDVSGRWQYCITC